jgi:hypothetical protein
MRLDSAHWPKDVMHLQKRGEKGKSLCLRDQEARGESARVYGGDAGHPCTDLVILQSSMDSALARNFLLQTSGFLLLFFF